MMASEEVVIFSVSNTVYSLTTSAEASNFCYKVLIVSLFPSVSVIDPGLKPIVRTFSL